MFFSLRRVQSKRPVKSVARLWRSSGLLTYALLVCSFGRLKSNQLEAARKVARRRLRRSGSLKLVVFATIPFTQKPLQSRMGRGKGRIAGRFCWVKPGQPLFVVTGVPSAKAFWALRAAQNKLPLSSVVVDLNSVHT